jgi:geranylgeranyl diphosphate synthase type I
MDSYWLEQKQDLATIVPTFISEVKKQLPSNNPWGEDALQRLADFSITGKMVRGSLVLLSSTFNQPVDEHDSHRAAAALEILHSSILIHDDIMDEDKLRRGNPSVFTQYEKIGEERSYLKPRHFGESMASCVGISGYFIAIELLNQLATSKTEIIGLVSNEMTKLGFAQMLDVESGAAANKNASEQSIEELYIQKTGRYTFSLPLMVGSLLSNVDKKTIQKLEIFGERAGILFQIGDDLLGIFGDESVTGKPLGSDIIQKKQTIPYIKLKGVITEEDLTTLQSIYNATDDVTLEQITLVQDFFRTYNIETQLRNEMSTLAQELTQEIEALAIPPRGKELLVDIITYCINRNK